MGMFWRDGPGKIRPWSWTWVRLRVYNAGLHVGVWRRVWSSYITTLSDFGHPFHIMCLV